VHLDHDVDVRSDRVADCFDQADRALLLLAVQLVKTRTEGVQLERPIAALQDALRGGVEVLRRALDGVPTVGVRLDASV
jgi:hypothetical protein